MGLTLHFSLLLVMFPKRKQQGLTAGMRQLPASVLDGKSRVVAFRFRREKSEEERKLDMGKEGEEDGENTGAQAAG